MVPPEDVAELAQSKGIPIYMISTREAKLEPVSSTVFKRMSAATGGEAYFAKTWKQQQKAFASIRNDLAHLYSLELLPASQSQPGMACDHGEAGGRTSEGLPRPDPQWLPAAVDACVRRDGHAALGQGPASPSPTWSAPGELNGGSLASNRARGRGSSRNLAFEGIVARK